MLRSFYLPVICSFHPTGGASAELRKLRLLARKEGHSPDGIAYRSPQARSRHHRVLATGKVTTKKTDSKRCPFRALRSLFASAGNLQFPYFVWSLGRAAALRPRANRSGSRDRQGYHYKRKNGALLCSVHFYMPVICSFPQAGALCRASQTSFARA